MSSGNWSVQESIPFVGPNGYPMEATRTKRRYWSGLDDPNKKKQNSYTLQIYEDSNQKLTYRETDGREFDTAPMYFAPSPLPVISTWNTYDENVLLDKLLGKINGHQFNLAVSLVEAKDTIGIITNAAKRIDKVLRSLKRGDIPAAFRILGLSMPRRYSRNVRSISDHWLELQFGWLPLISDVHDAAIAASRHIFPPLTDTFSVSRRHTDSAFKTAQNGSLWLLSNTTSKRLTVHITELSSEAVTLGLTDPASVLWEKVPYSFVVDWFIPIGTYLRNRSQIPALKTDSVMLTTKVDTFWGCAGFPKATTKVEGYQKTFSFVRSASATVAPPKFTSLKHSALHISATHAADTIALLVGRHGSK